MPKVVYFDGSIALKSNCNVHLLHIAYVHFKAHFVAHFRTLGNHFRTRGNLNSLFVSLLLTFAMGNNSVSRDT